MKSPQWPVFFACPRFLRVPAVGLTALICASLPAQENWIGRDIGNVAPSGTSAVSGGVFTLRGAGADIWGSADAFRFHAGPASGDVAVAARVTALDNTHAWAKAGVMFRADAGAGAANVMILRTPNNTIALQHRSASGTATTQVLGSYGLSPAWLMLSRSGNRVSGYESRDGQTWRLVGTVETNLPSTIEAGLAVTSHLNGTLATATFDNVDVVGDAGAPPPPPPAPPPDADGTWSGADIGTVGMAGAQTISGSDATVTGSGADIWGTADGFRFAHRTLSGDGEIVARVVSMNGTDGWAKAGVMIRESLAPGAAFAYALISRSNGAAFQFRGSTNASAQSAGQSSALRAPQWVRLVRSGAQFAAYVSADGSTWTQLGVQNVAMAGDVHVGLAVTSHDNRSSNTAVFASIAVASGSAPAPGPAPDPTRPAAPTEFKADGASPSSMRLTWRDNAADETGFVIERNTSRGYITVGSVGPNVTTWTDDGATNPDGNPDGAGLRSGTTYFYTLRAVRGSDESLTVTAQGTTPASTSATWSSADVGSVGVAGSIQQSGSTVTVRGSGADIWGTADGFHFAHRRLLYNGEIIARVASLSNTHTWAKAGVMLRESLAPNAPFALMLVSPGSGVSFQYRTGTGSAAEMGSQGWGVAAPQWVRLVRTGNTITAFTSTDRTNWTPRGSATVSFSAEVYVGLAVTSHNNATLNTAVFEEVSVLHATGQ